MRLIRLARSLPPAPGGLEVHARELTLQQAEDGATVDLVYAVGEAPVCDGVVPHRVHATFPGLPGRFSAQAFAWAVGRWGRRGIRRADVIHAHGDYADAWVAISLAQRMRCPSVLTLHGGLSERRAQRSLARIVFPRLSHVIAVSESIRDQVMARGVRPDQVSVISSGIHYGAYREPSPVERDEARAVLGVPVGGLLVVSVGRLHPVKGFSYLIEAWSWVAEAFENVHLVIAGDGPDAESLRCLASRTSNVRLAGALDAGRVARLLEAADLFVLPSVILAHQAEGTPTSIMEAMAAGLPVVATRTGGIPQLVQDGRHGLVVPQADRPALAGAIIRLLADPRARREIGARNRAAVADRDWPAVARRVGEAYAMAGVSLVRPSRK